MPLYVHGTRLWGDTLTDLVLGSASLELDFWKEVVHYGAENEHIQLTQAKANQAVSLGARVFTDRELVALIRSKRANPPPRLLEGSQPLQEVHPEAPPENPPQAKAKRTRAPRGPAKPAGERRGPVIIKAKAPE